MNYHNPQLLDELASQYVLGTLRGRARDRFERIVQRHADAQSALQRWEDRLMGLMSEVKPVAPPARVWSGVQKRLGHGRTQKSGFFDALFGWLGRPQLAMAAGIAAIAFAVAIVTYISIPQIPVIAQFQDWSIKAPKDHSRLSVARLAGTTLDPNKDYELWALPDSGAAPVSLGLMPKSGDRTLQLSAAQRAALAGASKIAVSLEPIGGSPTGAPTGPVLFVTEVVKA